MNDLTKYIDLAKSYGAVNVVAVTPDEIVFDGRTILKCMFGCGDWGKGCTCPSRYGALSTDEWEKLLRKYSTVLIIHANDKKTTQNASLAIENEAYLDGNALSFSMSDCALCSECAGMVGQPCRQVMKARPAFHSVGIDVFKTAHNLGLPLKALRDKDEEQNWYAAVWLD